MFEQEATERSTPPFALLPPVQIEDFATIWRTCCAYVVWTRKEKGFVGMRNILLRLTVPVLAWMLAVGLVASAQAGQGSTAASPDIKSERMEVTSNGWFRATGKVVFRFVDHELRADQVDFNNKTGHVKARGHVELIRPAQGRWVGDALDFNYITKEGLTGLSESKSGTPTTTAKEKGTPK